MSKLKRSIRNVTGDMTVTGDIVVTDPTKGLVLTNPALDEKRVTAIKDGSIDALEINDV